MRPAPPPDRGIRLLVYLTTWIVALGASVPWVDWLIGYYPAGLIYFFASPGGGGGMEVVATGSILYVLHAVFLFRTRSRGAYWAAYGIFLAMLVMNFFGLLKAWQWAG